MSLRGSGFPGILSALAGLCLNWAAVEENIPVVEALTREELGHAIGKAQRTAVVILDNNFAKMLQR